MSEALNKNYLTLNERKEIGLNILKNVRNFCKEHNIKYYIAYGTLLGGVRHHGFIPWDDDIDLIMFRNDYELFLSTFNRYNKHTQFKSITFEDNSFYLPYTKVVDTTTKVDSANFKTLKNLGVFIDIFPFDYLSDDLNIAIKKKKSMNIYNKLLRYSLYNDFSEISTNALGSPHKWFLYIFAQMVGTKIISKAIKKKINKLKSNILTKYCGCFAGNTGENLGCLASDIFGEGSSIVFENNMFDCPKEYETYLKSVYGNYMELPPEEQRIAHSIKAYKR